MAGCRPLAAQHFRLHVGRYPAIIQRNTGDGHEMRFDRAHGAVRGPVTSWPHTALATESGLWHRRIRSTSRRSQGRRPGASAGRRRVAAGRTVPHVPTSVIAQLPAGRRVTISLPRATPEQESGSSASSRQGIPAPHIYRGYAANPLAASGFRPVPPHRRRRRLDRYAGRIVLRHTATGERGSTPATCRPLVRRLLRPHHRLSGRCRRGRRRTSPRNPTGTGEPVRPEADSTRRQPVPTMRRAATQSSVQIIPHLRKHMREQDGRTALTV